MANGKVSPEVKQKIFELLQLKYSFSMIHKELKKYNINVSNYTISKIKNTKTFLQNSNNKMKNNRKKLGPKFKLKLHQLKSLEKEVTDDNPKSHNQLACKFNVHRTTISRNINKILGLKRTKKKSVHHLTDASIKKRYERSRSLLQYLKSNYKKIITTDEKLFHLCEANQETTHYYKKPGEKSHLFKSTKNRNFSKSVMMWGGVSYNGKTRLRFIKPGVKINASEYQRNILNPFLEKDAKKLYPDNDFIFHQDSAPSHASKSTIKYLNDRKINFITPELWTPNSPDNAPMDYFVWGYMVNKLRRKKVKNIDHLKRVLLDIWKNIPQNLINKALDSWPGRCKLILRNKGKQIEHLL
jgi:hypothetical protein